MSYTENELNDIYDKTFGYCFYCDMKLAFTNYGRVGSRGAWEVDHFVPKRSRGIHNTYNWVPACVHCNTVKSCILPWHFDPYRFIQGDRDPSNYV
jgi:5-methylcytosine-specific restriction endonuclease McrA